MLNSSLKHQVTSFWKKDLLLSFCLWRHKFGTEGIVNGSSITKKIIKEKYNSPNSFSLLASGEDDHQLPRSLWPFGTKAKRGLEINKSYHLCFSGLFSSFGEKTNKRKPLTINENNLLKWVLSLGFRKVMDSDSLDYKACESQEVFHSSFYLFTSSSE